ncbi:hypothetical protein Tco_1322512 [Tanacetum coccineum]
MSSLETLIMQHNERAGILITPIRLTFIEEEESNKGKDNNKELARRFADQVPQTVTEMIKRVDDFVKSEEAYKSMELPKGEHPEKGQRTSYKERGDDVAITKRRRQDFHSDGVTDLAMASERIRLIMDLESSTW